MNGLWGCLRKDRLEYVRSHKNIICIVTLLACGAVVLVGTILLPTLLNKVMTASSFFSEDTSLSEFMEKFFPGDLKRSMGIFASDVGVFYGLLVIFSTYSLIPNDIRSGRIILPLCAGHSKKAIIFSKQSIYSVMMSVPVFAAYMLYYLIGSHYLTNNYDMIIAFLNGIVLAFSFFSIVHINIALSVLMKNKYSVLALMVSVVLVAPDSLSFLKIGRYFPTYLLTYTYNSSNEFIDLLVPLIITIAIVILLDLLAIESNMKIDIDERR